MTDVYLSYADCVHALLEAKLKERAPYPFEIRTTPNGKPYIEGDPVFFSLSHSGDRAICVICDRKCGIDLEVYKKQQHISVINRFSAREQAEIACERDFLKHWTAREAYVKLYGLQLAKMWRRVEFFGDILYDEGKPADVDFKFYYFYFGVAALCTEKK